MKMYDEPVESGEYAFISYSSWNKKSARVIIHHLCARGRRLWWDEGISPFTDWEQTIEHKIQNCSIAIIFLTEDFVQDPYSYRALNYILKCARKQAVHPWIVKIDEFEIPGIIHLLTNEYQTLFYKSSQSWDIFEKLDLMLRNEEQTRSLSGEALNYWAAGSYYESLQCFMAILEKAENKDKPWIYLSMGCVSEDERDYVQAVKYFQYGLQICEDLKLFDVTRVNLLEHLGMVYVNGNKVFLAPDGNHLDWYAYSSLSGDDLLLKAEECLERAGAMAVELGMPDKREYYHSFLENARQRIIYGAQKEPVNEELLQKVANFQRSSADLMEEILKNDVSPEAYNCIRTNLQRLINYCRIVGGLDQMISKCNEDLRNADEECTNRDKRADGKTGQDPEKNTSWKVGYKDYSAASREVTAFRNLLGLEKPGAPEYDVFISYKSEDQKLAERISDRIRRQGKRVFLATEELKKLGRSEYTEAIDEALYHSKHLVVVATNTDYLKTTWVKHEWSWFESQRRDGTKEGEILLVLDPDICGMKKEFPPTLMDKEIFPTDCFEERIFGYLW